MAITILSPRPAAPLPQPTHSTSSPSHSISSSDDEAPADSFSNASAKPPRRRKRGTAKVFTPGEIITTDPQWMRGHGTTVPAQISMTDEDPASPAITSTVAGTLTKTNKLLSITPLHARYQPSIGDLVVGRIVSISAAGKRWNVDIAAPLLASLPLSAINLPGGVLRRRTAVDELNVRSFFSEGDLLVAEVQDVRQNGSAGLHTRSLRYGKLRNGMFLVVKGAEGGREGGVVRSRRQISTFETHNGGAKVDVILGVNGYVFICAHMQHIGEGKADNSESLLGTSITKGNASVARREEEVSMRMYASANDAVDVAVRREIARIASLVRLLAEKGIKVDEGMVRNGYETACEMEEDSMDVENEDGLDGVRGAQLVQAVLARTRSG
ncbi:MAG: hypothetical protein Q9162_006608 [Coniocarpon cinnabarinum]